MSELQVQDTSLSINKDLFTDLTESQIASFKERVESGLQIDGQKELRYLEYGRWMLCYTMTNQDRPSRRNSPEWFQVGHIIEKAKVDDETKRLFDVVTPAENPGTPPFPVTAQFRQKFIALLGETRFGALCDAAYGGDDDSGLWFTEDRVACMQAFWTALQNQA